jgi:hypothetical protein
MWDVTSGIGAKRRRVLSGRLSLGIKFRGYVVGSTFFERQRSTLNTLSFGPKDEDHRKWRPEAGALPCPNRAFMNEVEAMKVSSERGTDSSEWIHIDSY